MIVKPIEDIYGFERRRWILLKDEKYLIRFCSKYYDVVVPKFFISNGASIPRFLRPFVESTGCLFKIAFLHDYMYAKGHFKTVDGLEHYISRNEADKIFRNYCLDNKIKKSICYFSYCVLNLFGWSSNNYWN